MESVRRKLLPNPRQTGNIFSKILLTWTIPIFVKGYKNDLNLDDVYQPLTEDRSDDLGDRLEKFVKFLRNFIFLILIFRMSKEEL